MNRTACCAGADHGKDRPQSDPAGRARLGAVARADGGGDFSRVGTIAVADSLSVTKLFAVALSEPDLFADTDTNSLAHADSNAHRRWQ
jgi:hypothetical protein